MLGRFETTTILKILQDGFAFLVVSENCHQMSNRKWRNEQSRRGGIYMTRKNQVFSYA